MTAITARLPPLGIRRPPLSDALLAVALGIAGLVEVALTTSRFAMLAPAVVATVIPLAWRRQAPFLTIVIGLGVVALAQPFHYPIQATYLLLELVIAFYSLGAWVEFRRSVPRAAAALLVVWALIAWQEPRLDNFVFVTLFYAGSWMVGVFVRVPRQRASDLERDADALEAVHREAARRAVEEERALIARELHDVVAHSVSVMVIQAGAVRRRLDGSQERERDALAGVEYAGREALEEMRRMLGVLRNAGDQPSLAPQPGLSDLGRLVEQTRAAGLPVRFDISGQTSLPAGLGLTVYRVVQEALTNALKHGARTQATVTVTAGPRAVELEVLDEGHGTPAPEGPGHGLIGMRERVAVYGGTLTTGPENGGFVVRARLPIQEPGATLT